MRVPSLLRASALALTGFAGSAAYASFHFMQIEQVIGGVDGDTSAQAIQLRMRTSFQNIVSGAQLWAWDATGSNRIRVLDMASNVGNSAAGSRVLIVSSNFVRLLGSPVSPEFVMTQTIPASYLAAGRLTYEQDGGTVSTPGTILWSLSWGGAGYTGSQTGDLSNDSNGNFGPAFGNPLPSASRQAVIFTGTAAAASTSNAADYSLSANPATFVNNAGTASLIFSKPSLTAISRETNNIRVAWTTVPGRTNFLQRTAGTTNDSLSTNFTDIFAVPNYSGTVTNYLDVGAATNSKSGYYRLRLP